MKIALGVRRELMTNLTIICYSGNRSSGTQANGVLNVQHKSAARPTLLPRYSLILKIILENKQRTNKEQTNEKTCSYS